jgi:dephospho-CoA kinase
MLRIGLTGGIGSGKSTVSGLFREQGVAVIDADEISRQLTAPGGAAVPFVLEAFGPSVFHPDGNLNRAVLRERVFADPEERRKLEAVLHPLIYAALEERARLAPPPYVVLCVPLLLETGQRRRVDRVLVIDAPLQVQKERIRQRDGTDDALIGKIIASQLSRAERLEQADDIIRNENGRDDLARQVADLHRRYLELAEPRGASLFQFRNETEESPN